MTAAPHYNGDVIGPYVHSVADRIPHTARYRQNRAEGARQDCGRGPHGDLVKLDLVAEKDGFYADAAVTIRVGEVSVKADELARCAERAFHYEHTVVITKREPILLTAA